MDFFGRVTLSSLPFVTERREVVNGKEQVCLLIPTEEAQLKRSKRGEYGFNFRLKEVGPNPLMHSHRMSLVYRTKDDAYKSQKENTFNEAADIGFMRPLDERTYKKKDRTNNMTSILATGVICLSDITPDDIETDPRTGKKYLRTTFKKMQLLDDFNNSHELVVSRPDGDIPIGLYREWPGASEQLSRIGAMQPKQVQKTDSPPPKEIPTKIDGLVF